MSQDDPLGLDHIQHGGDPDKALVLNALRRLADATTKVEEQLSKLAAVQLKQEEHTEKLDTLFEHFDELLDNKGEIRRLRIRVDGIDELKWRVIGWVVTSLILALGGLVWQIVTSNGVGK